MRYWLSLVKIVSSMLNNLNTKVDNSDSALFFSPLSLGYFGIKKTLLKEGEFNIYFIGML